MAKRDERSHIREISGEPIKATQYNFERDYVSELKKMGWKEVKRTVAGKQYPFLQKRNEKGEMVEYPIIEREIDVYVTGFYRVKKGTHRGESIDVKIRLTTKVKYIPDKKLLDKFRQNIEEKALDQFEEWANHTELFQTEANIINPPRFNNFLVEFEEPKEERERKRK